MGGGYDHPGLQQPARAVLPVLRLDVEHRGPDPLVNGAEISRGAFRQRGLHRALDSRIKFRIARAAGGRQQDESDGQ